MFQVCNFIYYFLSMILGIFSNFSLNAIYNRSRFFETVIQKNFEFVLCDRYGGSDFELVFVLLLAGKDLISDEWCSKEDGIRLITLAVAKWFLHFWQKSWYFMWVLPLSTSRNRFFKCFSQKFFGNRIARAKVWASKTVLRIC